MFEDAAEYNECNMFTIVNTRESLQEFHKYIKYRENNLILDVGSGSGNVISEVLLPVIPCPNFKLIGVDQLKSMVDFANNYVKDPRVSFRILNITERNDDSLKSVFTKEELNPGFDIIYSFSVVMWTDDHEQCLKNIFSLLRPGGQMFLWFVGYCTLCNVWESVRSKEKWQQYLKLEPIFKFPYHDSTDVTTECTDLLKKIGFQDIICDCVRKPQVLNPSDPWRKAVGCVDPHLHKIPNHLQTEYLDEVMDLFKEYTDKTNGLPFDRIVIVATKPLATCLV